ncbi:MAG: T9SS type A sorting domain-containing protein [Flavobacteriales bacterium]|nr:T9SS type A sorting domain-containing protein [Flavobacteriales bacterium]
MKNLYKKIGMLILINLISIAVFSQNNNAFRFKITGNNYSDETIIRLVNGATQNFDGNYDAWKLFSLNPNVPSIYTQVAVGQELSINALPEFTEDKSITIYTNIPVNGSYTINVEEIFALTSNYKISLTDMSSNTHYRLLGDTALTFNFTTQQNSPSFTFNISTAITTSISNETCFSMDDGSIMINNAGNTDWNIQILDAANNTVVNSNSNSSLNNYNNLLPGNYTAEVNSKGILDEFSFTIIAAANLTANFNLNKDTVYLSEGGEINVSNNSQNAQNYTWNFGDGGTSFNENPTYNYSTIGNFDITLSASNTNCISDVVKQVTVLQSPSVITSIDNINTENIRLANFGNGNYQLTTTNYSNKQISVYDISGKLVFEDVSSESNYKLSLVNNSSGIYILNVTTEEGQLFQEKLYR